MALSLGLDERHFDCYFSQGLHTLSFIRYSPQLSNLDKGILGCSPHTDWGFCTACCRRRATCSMLLMIDVCRLHPGLRRTWPADQAQWCVSLLA